MTILYCWDYVFQLGVVVLSLQTQFLPSLESTLCYSWKRKISGKRPLELTAPHYLVDHYFIPEISPSILRFCVNLPTGAVVRSAGFDLGPDGR